MTKPRIPYAKVISAEFAKIAPRCKHCREVQANHTDAGDCLFAPLRWEAAPSVPEPYSIDIRKIISDNSVKDWAP